MKGAFVKDFSIADDGEALDLRYQICWVEDGQICWVEDGMIECGWKKLINNNNKKSTK